MQIARVDLSRQQIFDDYYRPSSFSSFDDILSRSFISCAPHSTAKGKLLSKTPPLSRLSHPLPPCHTLHPSTHTHYLRPRTAC